MANDLTLIGSAGANCSNTPYYELDGCADCVPYKKFIPLSDCSCPSDVIKYINLDTGEISTTEPANFAIGACSDKPDGKVCYALTEGTTSINVTLYITNKVLSSNVAGEYSSCASNVASCI